LPTFGERLRTLRVERELTQSQLGGSDFSTSYISRLEAGTRAPNTRVVALLAERLRVDPQWLMSGTNGTDDRLLAWRLRAAEVALAEGNASAAKQDLISLRDNFAPASQERRDLDLLLARAHARCAELDQATVLLEGLLDEVKLEPVTGSYATLAQELAWCYREAGDLHRAVEVAERAVEHLASLGLDSLAEFPKLVVTLAGASRERGDLAYASTLLRRLLGDLGTDITPRDRGSALWNAAIVAAERGQIGEGILLARRALELFESIDDERSVGMVRTLLAWVILSDAQADPAEALGLLIEARDSLLSQGLQIDSAYAETELARAMTALGQPKEAVNYATSALGRLQDSPDALESARARTAMGHAMLALGEGSLAVAELEEAAVLLRKQAASRQAAAIWRDLAQAHVGVGDLPAALVCLDEALRAAGVPGSVAMIERRHVRVDQST
jgi:tetratricopeptide (TPR) repeat protein